MIFFLSDIPQYNIAYDIVARESQYFHEQLLLIFFEIVTTVSSAQSGIFSLVGDIANVRLGVIDNEMN